MLTVDPNPYKTLYYLYESIQSFPKITFQIPVYLVFVLQFNLKHDWNIQTDGKYQTEQSDAQFALAAKGGMNIAASKKLSPLATLKLSISDLLNTNINQGAIENLYETKANFRNVSDTRAVILTLSMRFGQSVAAQRKHNQTGADDENGRVKN